MNKIDLSKNQLVEGDLLVKVWCNDYQIEKRYLHSIDHTLLFPFVCFAFNSKRSDLKKEYNLYGWKNCELIEPKYRVKDFYSLVETLKSEGYQPYEKNENVFIKHTDSELKILNWKKLLLDHGKIVSEEYIKENNIKESWLEEVEE